MRNSVCIFFLVTAAFTAQCQINPSGKVLTIGDTAPPLHIGKWIKGEPIDSFKKKQIYVVEIWATWCKPCIESMPKLSKLSKQFKNKVTILGVNCYEKDQTNVTRIQSFVESMGKKIGYTVAIQDSNFMEIEWMQASGTRSIPNCFIVNQENKIAWIGHTDSLKVVLKKLVSRTWDLKVALNDRNTALRLEKMDTESNEKLYRYLGEVYSPFKYGDPDSALLLISNLLSIEPNLKFSPSIAKHTFSALLRTNVDSAYKYGMEAIHRNNYEAIIDGIKNYYDPFNIPSKIYSLGAFAFQEMIKDYPLVAGTPKNYMIMSEWYWKANDKLNAIRSQKKVLKLLKKSEVYASYEVY